MASTLVIVTGASRGYGAVVCEVLCSALTQPHFVMCARSLVGLEATRTSMGGLTDYRLVAADLSLPSSVPAVLSAVPLPLSSYDRLILVHNVGSLGALGAVAASCPPPPDFFALNVTVPMLLTGALLAQCDTQRQRVTVVNVTSLCAIRPFAKTWQYCAAKAARDMAFACLAAEEPLVDVISYAPGPMETDMRSGLLATCPEMSGPSVDMAASARKLAAMVVAGGSKSHIDFYDV